MPFLHICNTFFEQELEGAQGSLKYWLNAHRAYGQLQYLPLLYAQPEDRVLVTHLPSYPDPRLCLIDNPPSLPIESWGASRAIEQFAAAHGLVYRCPDFDLVHKIHSKSFAFTHSPHLPGAQLLYTEKEVLSWIEKNAGPKVLKTVLGTSGRGHFFVGERDPRPFFQKEFAQGRSILGEPWVSRAFDFSSQWEIGSEIELQGLTVFETSDKGAYRATLAGPAELLFGERLSFAKQHLEIARPILQKIQAMGFFGSLGIDAFVYNHDQLHPIVEINARKTMSRVALEIQKKQRPDGIVRMSFEAKPGGLLPGRFVRNIFLENC